MAMLSSAVELIERAKEFNGYPLNEEPTERSESAISVYISLVFKNESDIIKFIESL